jgi:hypothetical protein
VSENEIMAQIHRHREEVARRCDYDVDKLFAYYREQQDRWATEGWRVVPVAGESKDDASVIREEPPKPEAGISS